MSNLEIDSDGLASVLLHAVALRSGLYGWTTLRQTPMNDWVVGLKGGHSNYLTIWALVMSSTAFALLLVCRLLAPPLRGTLAHARLKKAALFIRDAALPLVAIVTIVYGGLIFVARAIVAPFFLPSEVPPAPAPGSSEFPDVRLFFLPISTDLALHGLPLIFTLLSTALQPGRVDSKQAAQAIVVVGVAYAAQIERCSRYNHDLFPYPFLTISPRPVRLMMYAGFISIAIWARPRLRALVVAPYQV